jgi:hypothetical protein
MSRSGTLPVVAIGKNSDNLPTRLSVPGLTKKVPIMSNGRRPGSVDPDGKVTWIAPGSSGSWQEFSALSDGLREASWARKRLRAAVIGGKVAAVVVPPRRRR